MQAAWMGYNGDSGSHSPASPLIVLSLGEAGAGRREGTYPKIYSKTIKLNIYIYIYIYIYI
jgi:hypothetical protein